MICFVHKFNLSHPHTIWVDYCTLISVSLPTALPGLSPGAIAGIAVGTIVGLVLIVGILLLVFFCGILVAGRWTFSGKVCGCGTIVFNTNQFPGKFLKQESPAAPPATTEISLRDNVAYESYNREKDQDNDDQYEKLDEYKA